MLCPVCKEEMIVIEVDQVEVDYCVECKGVWLDGGEMDILLELSGVEPGPLTQAIDGGGSKVPGRKRRCPACGTKLYEVRVPDAEQLVIDRCPRAHGLWFDDRELGRLIDSAGGAPETEALARLCGRMLSSERAKKEADDNVGTDSVE